MTATFGIVFLILMGAFLVVGQTDARRSRDYEDDDEMENVRGGFGGRSWSNARVRAVHLSPDAPAVDIWVNGNKVISNLAFGEYTPYLSVPFSRGQSTYNFKVVPAGLTSPVVINADLKLKPVRDYTIVASGRLADIKPIVIEDLRPVRPIFNSWVRFVHTSPDAPNVDIAVQNGGPVLFSDVAFRDVERYIRVTPGSYDLEVRVAGTNIVALSLDDIPLVRGKSYTVFATGLLSPGEGEPGLGALLVMDR
jgi:hypothetical protein